MPRTDGSYSGRLALVTGGSSGIGLELAKLLAAEGARVWILARDRDRLAKAADAIGGVNGSKPGVISADVRNAEHVQEAVQQIKREAGAPDILVNAAGASHPEYVQQTGLDIFRHMMDLNYFGTVQMVQAWMPDLLARGSGHIVNFSSIAGFWAPFGYAAYSPSKFAVRGYCDSLRLELKPLGIRVSVVFPPDTDTPGMENENKTKPFETKEAFGTKLTPAKDVAKGVLRGMKRGHYVILPGFESSLYYRLMFVVGDGIYPIFDMLLADARRKKNKR